ncbi:MAG: permease-like cell division protein FtsX [Wenzhouxiangella sp.]
MSKSRGQGRFDALPGSAGLRAWARRHAYSFLSSLGSLTRQPLASAMTVIVLGVALTLPVALHVTLDNVQRLADGWERMDTLSVFLDQSVNEAGAMQLATRLASRGDIDSVDPISPDTGLAELSGQLALGELREQIDDNPLPWVLEVSPMPNSDVSLLVGQLENESGVDLVIVDLAWLERLDAIVALLEQLVLLLAILFAVGVAFIIANTIRMDIQNRREEIEVMALVGATAAFIRRPFLYSGLWYGLLGGALAWLLVRLGLLALTSPVARLSGSYASQFQLYAPSAEINSLLIGGAGLFGIIGSWLVVGQHLRRIGG